MNATYFLLLQVTVKLPEIIIFLLGALILGFTLNFFWNARRQIKIDDSSNAEGISDNDNWKLKYYTDMDMQEKIQQQLREKLSEAKENEQMLSIEVESLQTELEQVKKLVPAETEAKKPDELMDYMIQLRNAQQHMQQYHQQINRLLEQIQALKEAEKKYLELQQTNASLEQQVTSLHKTVTEKEQEIVTMKQQMRLSQEMSERMEKAYAEFSVLQNKIQKLETHLAQPSATSLEYEQLQQSYLKLSKDFDETKARQMMLWDENQRLTRILSDTEDKLREANFQRQQLHKKTTFLEELNNDLQEVAEHNKKLEGQLRRISDMQYLLQKSGVTEKNDI